MSGFVLLPRVDRRELDELLEELLPLPITEIQGRMPADLAFTYAPTGGVQGESGLLPCIRGKVLELAIAVGYPDDRRELGRFEAECARMLHSELRISPHEAGHREVWGCLTGAHLLDVAVWRWDGITDERRVNGDVNRDTFRRLWWRYEILGEKMQPPDGLRALGEDEVQAVLERPGVSGNPEVAQAIVTGFWARLVAEPDLVPQRMQLMRDAMKRLTRLSPFTAFDLLPRTLLQARIEQAMSEAGAAVRTL